MHHLEDPSWVEITRTVRQWELTARQLDGRDPRYPAAVQRIHGVLVAHPDACPDSLLPVAVTAEEAVVVLARAPLSAWWMPMPAVCACSPATHARNEAELIIQAAGRGTTPLT